jgi:hypothetical protein
MTCIRAGCWILVTGFWLLVTGYWSLVTGRWLLVAGYWSLVTGRWLLVADCRLLATLENNSFKKTIDSTKSTDDKLSTKMYNYKPITDNLKPVTSNQ